DELVGGLTGVVHLREDPGDDAVGGWAGTVQELVRAPHLPGELPTEPGEEDVVLVGEVAVQRVAGEADLGGDVADGDLAVAPLGEEADRGVEDRRLLAGHVGGDALGADA